MTIKNYNYELTNIVLAAYPWEDSDSKYVCILMNQSYTYSRIHSVFTDVQNFTLGLKHDIPSRLLKVDTNKQNTIFSASGLEFKQNTVPYNARGILIIRSSGDSFLSTDNLVFWIDFNEVIAFSNTQKLDISSGIYLLKNELV